MSADKKIRVAIVGLGFGAEFIPIYQNHPGAEMYAICRRDRKELDECGDRFGDQGALHRLRRGARRPERRRRPHQLADPRPRAAGDRRARRPASTSPAPCRWPRPIEECRQIVEAQRSSGQGLHDDGDRRLQPRVPVRQGAVRQGRARPDPVPPRQPPAGHGRLARLLGGLAADALRHALRQPLPGAPRQARRARRLPRLGADRRGADPEVRQPVRHRDGDLQDRATPTSAPRSPAACSTPPGSTARASTPTAARSRSSGSRSRARSRSSTPARGARPSPRSRSASRCPTTPTSCPSRSAGSRPRRLRSRTTEHLSFLQGGGHGGSHPHLVHAFLMACIGRAAGPARRRDLGQLDHGRHLCPRVGAEGRREGSNPAILRWRAVRGARAGKLFTRRLRHTTRERVYRGRTV